jgi:hypothetical protein
VTPRVTTQVVSTGGQWSAQAPACKPCERDEESVCVGQRWTRLLGERAGLLSEALLLLVGLGSSRDANHFQLTDSPDLGPEPIGVRLGSSGFASR